MELAIDAGFGLVWATSAAAAAYTGYRDTRRGYYKRGKKMGKRARHGDGASGDTPTLAPVTPTKGGTPYAQPSRYHHELGLSMRASTMRRNARGNIPGTGAAPQDKTPSVWRMVSIPYSDGDTNLGVRTGKYCNVYGVKAKMIWQLRNDFEMRNPVTIRWAVVNPKDNDGSNLSSGLPNWFVKDEFESQTETCDDFGGTGDPGANDDWLDLMTRKINKRDWGVLQSGHFTLSPNPNADVAYDVGAIPTYIQTVSSKKYLELNIPIKKQMKWADLGTGDFSSFPETNVYFVWWWCDYLSTSANSDYLATTPVLFSHRFITYFKNGTLND